MVLRDEFYTKSQSFPVAHTGDSVNNILFIDFLFLPDLLPLRPLGVS